jgi:SH3-like domain-containing protein
MVRVVSRLISGKSALVRRRLPGVWACVSAFGMGVMAATPVLALDYLAAAQTAVLYDGPSVKARELRIVVCATPVEQIVVVGAWVKVREPQGKMGWIEKAQLTEKRTVIVRTPRAQVRKDAADTSALVFEAETDVVLDLVETGPAGWVRVRHVGGQEGFVRGAQVWGL